MTVIKIDNSILMMIIKAIMLPCFLFVQIPISVAFDRDTKKPKLIVIKCMHENII